MAENNVKVHSEKFTKGCEEKFEEYIKDFKGLTGIDYLIKKAIFDAGFQACLDFIMENRKQ